MTARIEREIFEIRVLGDQPLAVTTDEGEVLVFYRLFRIEPLDPVALLGERYRDLVGTFVPSSIRGPRQVPVPIPRRDQPIRTKRQSRDALEQRLLTANELTRVGRDRREERGPIAARDGFGSNVEEPLDRPAVVCRRLCPRRSKRERRYKKEKRGDAAAESTTARDTGYAASFSISVEYPPERASPFILAR